MAKWKCVWSIRRSTTGADWAWRYPKAEYPVLTEWKMMRAGFYAVGVEPGNCHVERRVKERESGTLHMIAPREVRTFSIEVEFFNNPLQT